MSLQLTAAVAAITFASVAVASSAVENADVLRRIKLMIEIRDTTAALTAMAQQAAPFDADLAGRLTARLRADAAAIPNHFEFEAGDPESRALPQVWSDWRGFLEAAAQAERSVAAVDTDSVAQLRQGMSAVEGTCADCHARYRSDRRTVEPVSVEGLQRALVPPVTENGLSPSVAG